MTDGPATRPTSRVSAIALLLVFVAGVIVGLLLWSAAPQSRYAQAQPMRPVGAGGIMAFPAQLDKDMYGIVMIDVDAGTLWVYEVKRPNQLKLMAARSWMYDRRLEQYNCAPPTPEEVAELIARQVEQPSGKGTENSGNTAPGAIE